MRCNKCGSGLDPRCAARAALDLEGAGDVLAGAWWPHRDLRRTTKADNADLTGHGTLQQMWELACQRSAARAALDFMGAGEFNTCTFKALMLCQCRLLQALMPFKPGNSGFSKKVRPRIVVEPMCQPMHL